MASACINNVGVSPENFLDCSPTKYKSYGWLSPRISTPVDNPEVILDPEVSVNEMVDFEFRLEDPVNMLPADELFSDGKLMPLQLPTVRPAAVSTSAGVRSPETPKIRMRNNEISRKDPYLFSPKAPRCSSRWREILGLKKLQNDKHEATKNCSNAHKSLKNFLNRSSKSSTVDSSLHLPLLNKDSDNESISISSSRLSLSSSSSSGHEHDDLPRLSLDSDKPSTQTNHNSNPNPPRIRLVKHRALSSENPIPTRLAGSPINKQPADSTLRGLSIDDSPRMNSSGKIIFHNLGRSSSSPSSFNGGPRYKHGGGVERSYSANVRVTTVLNVPVCSSLRGSSKSGVFGFPLFSSATVNKKHHCSSNTATGHRMK
ncbi:uncharacterized protein LOC107032427 isoform X1 [Solanum pennellii]|uniref:Uncharacterized protein LOC107032427 isoform X1 n=2 Tax=Solanum pennellii TaxID=28526 RepID=A0ABM1HS35_SOLPN|nr:uncharacterized protein LOC107032427 isoform X1 [Solanum pennellii]